MQNELEIEKGVPVPADAEVVNKYRKYRFKEFEVGDSMFFPKEKSGGRSHDAAKKHGRLTGKKFVARTYRDGMRIWRTE